jgi:hypothetical protein
MKQSSAFIPGGGEIVSTQQNPRKASGVERTAAAYANRLATEQNRDAYTEYMRQKKRRTQLQREMEEEEREAKLRRDQIKQAQRRAEQQGVSVEDILNQDRARARESYQSQVNRGY